MEGIYPISQEDMLHNVPRKIEKALNVSLYVGADHAGILLSQSAHTGIIIYTKKISNLVVHKALEQSWYFELQISIFALHIATETTEALR